MRLLALIALLTLTACPGKPRQSASNVPKPPASPAITVALLRTDLGLADGGLVRDADAALQELAQGGWISYAAVGELPTALQTEGGKGDVGLPGVVATSGTKPTGVMDLADATELAGQLKSCDVLIVSSPLGLKAAEQAIAATAIGRIVVLDSEGPPPPQLAQQVDYIEYDIREAAYLIGVAAAVSSRSQAFVAFTSDQDPNADDFLTSVENGIHNRMRGGNVYHQRLSPDEEGIVAPEQFSTALVGLLQGLQTDHYIVAAGRATPSIMYGLSSNPTNGYALGGYGDFRQVRPARIVGCVVKRPGVVLREWFEGVQTLGALHDAIDSGSPRKYGLREGAVDVTDLKAYANFNPDAVDIAKAVADVRSEILGDELDVTK